MKNFQIFISILTLFLFVGCGGKGTPNKPNLAQIPTIKQTPTDKPKDKQIQVRVAGNQKLCYVPEFSLDFANNSYIAILNCSLDEASQLDTMCFQGFLMR